MKKSTLFSIAAMLVIGGSVTTLHAQKIPGKGLQKASYVPASQLDRIVGCSTGGCATAPMSMGTIPQFGGGCLGGGCATEPHMGCGESAPIPCFPLTGLGKIPRIIPSFSVPDCGSPMLSNCLGNACSITNSIGRAFARGGSLKPQPGMVGSPGCARIMGPGSASISDCDPCGNGGPGFANLGGGACGPGGNLCGLGSGLGSGLGACGGGLCGSGVCGGGLCGSSGFGYPDQGWNAPIKTPITRNPVGYARWHPSQWYGSAGAGFPGMPQVYRPTDTTQLGYTYQNVPYWRRGRAPGMPAPASIHTRSCPSGAYSTFGQSYLHRSHHDYPWYLHHMSDAARQPGASAANIAAARRPAPRRTAVPRRPAKAPVMQAGFRRAK